MGQSCAVLIFEPLKSNKTNVQSLKAVIQFEVNHTTYLLLVNSSDALSTLLELKCTKEKDFICDAGTYKHFCYPDCAKVT